MTDKEELIHAYKMMGHEPIITCASDCCWECAICEVELIDDNRQEYSTSKPCKGKAIPEAEAGAKKVQQLCIESDEAREYWRGQDYDIQQRAVQLAVLVERTRFVEQACEAIDKEVQLEHDSVDPETGYDRNYKEAYMYAVNRLKQAIRDRFNAASD